jgi:transcriptional regulator with XRE-family HTH domain
MAAGDRRVRDYALAVGARLRGVRGQQGLSLQAVELKSGGRWKISAVGSYERGDRMIGMEALAGLAQFYGVPVAALLPDGDPAPARGPVIVVDLRRLADLPAAAVDEAEPLRRWVRAVQGWRGDWGGRVLSLGRDDVRPLSVMYDADPAELVARFAAWGVLHGAVLRQVAGPHTPVHRDPPEPTKGD